MSNAGEHQQERTLVLPAVDETWLRYDYELWDCKRHGHQRVEWRDGTGVNARLINVTCGVCGCVL